MIASIVAGCSSGRSGPSSTETAWEVCSEFHLPKGTLSGMKIALVSPMTAGKVTELAQHFLGHGLSPWDNLPSNHFVADCGYASPEIPSGGPTTVCPDGSIVDLTPAPSADFYVDQQQRSSSNPLTGAVIGAGPSC